MTWSKSLMKVDLILQDKVYSSFCAVAAARGGVLGASYCLILTALGEMTGDKLSKRGSRVWKAELGLGSAAWCWKKELCGVMQGHFLAFRKLLPCSFPSTSIHFWFIKLLTSTLIPVIPITGSQIQEHKGLAFCTQFCHGFAKLTYFRPEKCPFFCS